MSIRKTPFIVGEWYHCYSRGIDKCVTFFEDVDYWRFLEDIHIANRSTKLSPKELRSASQQNIWKLPNDSPLVAVTAYCLMPNHFHILLKEITDGGISAFMQKLGTAYTMYFNKKYDRSGGLFTRPFRSKHVDKDPYLTYLIDYIHMNPTELVPIDADRAAEMLAVKGFLENYPFSSFIDHQGVVRPQSIILGEALP